MFKFLVSLLISILFTFHSYAATILIYHKIGDNRTPSTNVSIKQFAQQMKYLKNKHYTILSLKTLINLIKLHKKLPKNSVAITFDDGYRTVYKNAFPILKKYHFKAAVFLPTEAIEKHYPDYMTLKQIKEMYKYGIDFQSHSYSHPRMAYKPKGMTTSSYINFISNQLTKSRHFFIKYLGYKPTMFAIPYGEYNKLVIKTAQKLGYSAIFTQDTGSVNRFTPLYLIPREPILGKYWSTMKHFKYVLNQESLTIKERIPNIGVCKFPHIVGARINNIDRYKNFRIYTTQTGWIDAKVHSNLVFAQIKQDNKKRKKMHIGISATDKINRKEAKSFWMIVLKNN